MLKNKLFKLHMCGILRFICQTLDFYLHEHHVKCVCTCIVLYIKFKESMSML